jgi:hypothetical protein
MRQAVENWSRPLAFAAYLYLVAGATTTAISNGSLAARFVLIPREPISAYALTVFIYVGFGTLLWRDYGGFSLLHLAGGAAVQDLVWNALYLAGHPWFARYAVWPYFGILTVSLALLLHAQRDRLKVRTWTMAAFAAYAGGYLALGMPNVIFDGWNPWIFALEMGYVLMSLAFYARLVGLAVRKKKGGA